MTKWHLREIGPIQVQLRKLKLSSLRQLVDVTWKLPYQRSTIDFFSPFPLSIFFMVKSFQWKRAIELNCLHYCNYYYYRFNFEFFFVLYFLSILTCCGVTWNKRSTWWMFVLLLLRKTESSWDFSLDGTMFMQTRAVLPFEEEKKKEEEERKEEDSMNVGWDIIMGHEWNISWEWSFFRQKSSLFSWSPFKNRTINKQKETASKWNMDNYLFIVIIIFFSSGATERKLRF